MNRLIVLAPLALIACNSGPEVSERNASVEQVAAKAQSVMKIEPGMWTATTQVTAIDMPGMDDKRILKGITDQMNANKANSFTHCVTPEEANKPSSEMFAGKDKGQCTYDKFDMGNGRISAAMTCKPKAGEATMKMAMDGTYSTTAYDMTMDMNVANAAMPGGGMTMKAQTKGARTGACTAEQRKAG